MELAEDNEFLAAAITAVTGDLFLSTLVPGPNTKLPRRYCTDYLWSSRYRDPDVKVEFCKLESISERIKTWYCPKIPSKKYEEKPLIIKTLTGKRIRIFIDHSSFAYNLKEKIQDKINHKW